MRPGFRRGVERCQGAGQRGEGGGAVVQLGAQIVGGTRDVKGRKDSGHHGGRWCRVEDEGAARVDEVADELWRSAHDTSGAAERFGQGGRDDHIGLARETGQERTDAKTVGVVNEQQGASLSRDGVQSTQRR